MKRSRTVVRVALLVSVIAIVAFALRDWWSSLSSTNQITVILILFALSGVADALSAWSAERLRRKREAGIPAGLVKVVGAGGVALTDCNPEGKVRIGYETWTAIAQSAESIKAGDRVIVSSIRNGKIMVSRAADVDQSGEAG
jgi:membrane-bound ClpP family serine protease